MVGPLTRYVHGHSALTIAVNSRTLEAIREYAGKIQGLDELKAMISEHAQDCLDLVERIEKDGIEDPLVAVDLLLIDEALRYLSTRRDLYSHLVQNSVVVLLPLPPHLSDSFLRVADPNHVFSTDREMPPHLRNYPCRMLEELRLPELEQLAEGIKSVVLETYVEHNQIYVRDTAMSLLYLLGKKSLDGIFIHVVPHIPPRARFVELPIHGSGVAVMKV